MFSLSSLKSMEVIDINSGCKLGYIKDMVIDCENYKVISIVVPNPKNGWFSKINDIEVKWEDINKIGIDIILINAGEFTDIND